MGWKSIKEYHPGQVVVRQTNSKGTVYQTDVWERSRPYGPTTRDGHSTVIGGQRYDHNGKKIGPAGDK